MSSFGLSWVICRSSIQHMKSWQGHYPTTHIIVWWSPTPIQPNSKYSEITDREEGHPAVKEDMCKTIPYSRGGPSSNKSIFMVTSNQPYWPDKLETSCRTGLFTTPNLPNNRFFCTRRNKALLTSASCLSCYGHEPTNITWWIQEMQKKPAASWAFVLPLSKYISMTALTT